MKTNSIWSSDSLL